MKLLFDQNLSRKLVTRLADICPTSSHVQFHDLEEKTDTEIWEFAKINGNYSDTRFRSSYFQNLLYIHVFAKKLSIEYENVR